MKCPVCETENDRVQVRNLGRVDGIDAHCPRCGRYQLTEEAQMEVATWSPGDRSQLSGWLREQNTRGRAAFLCSSTYTSPPSPPGGVRITDVPDVLAPQSVAERIDRSLLNLSRVSEPGVVVRLTELDCALFFCSTAAQILFYICTFHRAGYLDKSASMLPDSISLSAKGWARVAELATSRTVSKQAFVAMWFDPSMNAAWTDGLMKGIAAAGYEPNRIDRVHHNEKICDRIVAEIRRSRFLVADVTGHRQGVYYEAGFAQALGLPVIWTCQKNDLANCHFDTRQYSHIVWETPDDLAQQLKDRIDATIT